MKNIVSTLSSAQLLFLFARTGIVLLFIYAAMSKVLDMEIFKAQLRDSPLLRDFAGAVSWLVPAAEILICLLLLFGKTQRAGLILALLMMLVFTAYIIAILTGPAKIPCSCGGVLASMSWTGHLIFNLFFIGLLSVALLCKPNNTA